MKISARTKWIVGILLTPVILPILLAIAIYIPFVQQALVDAVAKYASDETGMHITVEKVRLIFPLDLGVEGVLVTQKNESLPQVTDTIASIERVVADVQLWPLLGSEVEIDRFDMYGMTVNTVGFIPQARVKGSLGTLSLESHGIKLNEELVNLDRVYLADTKLNIALTDSVPEDTTTSENYWKIALSDLQLKNTDIILSTPGDTMQVAAHLDNLKGKDGYFDLGQGLYRMAKASVENSSVKYDNVFQPRSTLLSTADGGFDINHIALSGINVDIDSLYFKGGSADAAEEASGLNMLRGMEARLKLTRGELKEKCGVGINALTADVTLDSTQVMLITDIATRNSGNNPSSRVKANVNLDLSVLDSLNPGKVYADIDASLAKCDLMLAMGDMPKAFRDKWPSAPLTVKGLLEGNMNRVDISKLEAKLPTAFAIDGSGYAVNPTNMDRLRAKVKLNAQTYDMGFAKAMLDADMQKMINIPQMVASADITATGKKYDVDFTVAEGKGKVKGKGYFDANRFAYDANIDASGLNLGHFLKGMGLGVFSGEANVSGQGSDFKSAATNLQAQARIKQFAYDKWDLSGMNFDAQLKNGRGNVKLVSHNPLLDGTLALDALMSRSPIKATFTTELNKADLYHLYLADMPLTVSACAHIDISTDLNDDFFVQGLISDMTILDSAKVFRPDDMVLDILTNKDTTHAVVDCGDFHLNADLSGGYKKQMKMSDNIMAEIMRQWQTRIIDEKSLRKVLPVGHFYLSAGTDNPIARSLEYYDLAYSNIYIDATCSPEKGINGEMQLDTLVTNGMQIDYTRLKFTSDENTIHYKVNVENGPQNPQYTFRAKANGSIMENGVGMDFIVDDDKQKRIAKVSLAARMEQEGIRVCFDDSKQILGYLDFNVNKDNYLFFSNDMRLSADIKMKSSDGMGLQVYTDDENAEALQDVTISLTHFDLKRILSTIPYMPNVEGMMDGDFHAIVTPENISISSSVNANDLIFEKCPIGNLSSEFVYMPLEDGSHYIDGLMFKDGEEVGTLTGNYNPEGAGSFDVVMSMHDFPLDIANGFIPDRIIGLNGKGEGELTIKGTMTKPEVNGEVFMKNASLVSVPYGVTMRFDDTPVKISESRLTLDNFKLYSNNDQPLVCNGYVDFADTERIRTNLTLSARNFLIVDSKESFRSEAYGKAFVNFNALMTGQFEKLSVKGQLEVLSTTDLYYILRDSPINTDNRLQELVTFTDLSADNNAVVTTQRPTVNGMKVQMSINVQDGAHVKCWLNANHTNYVDIYAGGNLYAEYKEDELSVTGRCTISEGEMKYSLPVIPLKVFTIGEGSYIEFTGDVMNPRLNISAVEENKTTVTIDGVSQTVLFNCGVNITKTLNDMGLEFTIDAPENQVVSDELKIKSVEERAKLAVTMLTTGMYLTEDNTDNFTMNSALTSFLQSEINQIAGSAMRTLDLSVGLENSIDERGESHTDYAFKFAKRFWNNRLSISVGGKISTGPEVSGQNRSFFDNVELQYRLSQTSNQYLQLFYKRAVYDFLEGYLGQYGGGYMWKRKMQSLKDITKMWKKNDLNASTSLASDPRYLETMFSTDRVRRYKEMQDSIANDSVKTQNK